MRHPVISPSGFSYEREVIIEWLNRKPDCPYTKQKLTTEDLRINQNLHNLIKFLVLRERFNLENPKIKIRIDEICS